MNVELRPRLEALPTFLPVPAKADPANDNRADQATAALTAPHAAIYRPAKSSMTSGRAGTKRWLLEFEPQSPPFIEPLMGWTGSTDPMAQERLSFPTREAAVAYAERQGLEYEVREAVKPVKECGPVAQPQSQPIAPWADRIAVGREYPADA